MSSGHCCMYFSFVTFVVYIDIEKKICKSQNGEFGNGMREMRRIRLGIRGMRWECGCWGSAWECRNLGGNVKINMWRIRVAMQGIKVET